MKNEYIIGILIGIVLIIHVTINISIDAMAVAQRFPNASTFFYIQYYGFMSLMNIFTVFIPVFAIVAIVKKIRGNFNFANSFYTTYVISLIILSIMLYGLWYGQRSFDQ